MRTVVLLTSLIGVCTAQYPNYLGQSNHQEYGPPQPQAYGPPQQGKGYPQQTGQPLEEEIIPTVRHVFVHVAPDDESSGQARVIKAPIKRERQVNILFVKAPAPAAPDQQIVDIPNDGGRKTLVYVLLKKQEAAPDVDFKLPGPTPPSKPEIYFIRYKDGVKPPAPGGQYGPPAPGAPVPTRQYGAPKNSPVSGGY